MKIEHLIPFAIPVALLIIAAGLTAYGAPDSGYEEGWTLDRPFAGIEKELEANPIVQLFERTAKLEKRVETLEKKVHSLTQIVTMMRQRIGKEKPAVPTTGYITPASVNDNGRIPQ